MSNLVDEVVFEHDPNDKQLIVHYDEHAKYLNSVVFFFLIKKNIFTLRAKINDQGKRSNVKIAQKKMTK